MYLAIRARTVVTAFAASAMIAVASPVFSQDISDSHLKAARAAIVALTSTQQYDAVLPQAAQALKQELIQKNPDLGSMISNVVDEETLALAHRRGDLEKEAATIYAKIFTEQQLNEMRAFYESETGKKLLEDGALVARQVHEAAGIWQRGLARDLAQSVGSKVQAIIAANADKSPTTTEETTGQTDQ
ncbi:MAG: DUF2059 domain-containing protein [Rhizobiaceae bacterium]|nr:DUF2059 domain-containing protein [Rhizobiaceae bacterium]